MKIATIIVYLQPDGMILSTSASKNFLWKSAEEKFIKKQLLPVADALVGENGIHELSTPHGVYYAFIAPDRFAFLAVDEKIPTSMQLGIFEKIRVAKTNRELMVIMQDPVQAAKTKTDLILEQVDDLKKIMMSNIDKVLDRQDKIEYLLFATEELAHHSDDFKMKARNLKRRSQCPLFFPLFALFNTVKATITSYVWREQPDLTVENSSGYDYKPTRLKS
ncbi:MAG: hypothetical protein H0W64_08230 [Gammaproteobacteria bacterium]|nr:hypothetical protein [Gammaproteobacteria bacterium]